MFFGWIFAGMGLLFAGIGVWMVVWSIISRQRLSSWTPWEATIREIETRTTSSGEHGSRTRLVAHYEYRGPDGSEYASSGTLPDRRFRLDGTVPPLSIVINPLDPSKSMIAGTGGGTGCAIVFGVVFAGMGLLFASIGFGLAQTPI
ncbi:DUF3592 domain-containing protein [Nocardioides sp. NPDC059952]|uniref:DUF3592 domain-containing protein n=1 Tax=Nocardioides sp. NPDC059952 TaxID=3347014 RepID=UPI003668856E